MVITKKKYRSFVYQFISFEDSRPNQRDRTADSSDSDGDDNAQQYSPIPVMFSHFIFYKIIFSFRLRSTKMLKTSKQSGFTVHFNCNITSWSYKATNIPELNFFFIHIYILID